MEYIWRLNDLKKVKKHIFAYILFFQKRYNTHFSLHFFHFTNKKVSNKAMKSWWNINSAFRSSVPGNSSSSPQPPERLGTITLQLYGLLLKTVFKVWFLIFKFSNLLLKIRNYLLEKKEICVFQHLPSFQIPAVAPKSPHDPELPIVQTRGRLWGGSAACLPDLFDFSEGTFCQPLLKTKYWANQIVGLSHYYHCFVLV